MFRFSFINLSRGEWKIRHQHFTYFLKSLLLITARPFCHFNLLSSERAMLLFFNKMRGGSSQSEECWRSTNCHFSCNKRSLNYPSLCFCEVLSHDSCTR